MNVIEQSEAKLSNKRNVTLSHVIYNSALSMYYAGKGNTNVPVWVQTVNNMTAKYSNYPEASSVADLLAAEYPDYAFEIRPIKHAKEEDPYSFCKY